MEKIQHDITKNIFFLCLLLFWPKALLIEGEQPYVLLNLIIINFYSILTQKLPLAFAVSVKIDH